VVTRALFEQTMVPHPDAAFNLARWITRSDQEAEDIVQAESAAGMHGHATGRVQGNPGEAAT
jgi:RNA polymerase sigma-70 factor (ECF subfamily)